MIKVIVEIYSDPNYIKGYGYTTPPKEICEPHIWEHIYELCRLEEKQYVKHFLRDEFIENPSLGTYKMKRVRDVPGTSWEDRQQEIYEVCTGIPLGTRVFYLDVYMQ